MKISKAESPQMFDAISKRYDLLNRVLSFGSDRPWRMALVRVLREKQDAVVLDLGTGTADMAILIGKEQSVRSVLGVDLAEKMIAIGEKKVLSAGLQKKVSFQSADIQSLPFEDKTFDAVTTAFGMRNIPHIMKGIAEAYRVLKSGGLFCMLEFSLVKNPILRFGQKLYLKYGVPFLGLVFSGNLRAYKYLHETIIEFPDADRLNRMISQAGFSSVRSKYMCFGAVVLHVGRKA